MENDEIEYHDERKEDQIEDQIKQHLIRRCLMALIPSLAGKQAGTEQEQRHMEHVDERQSGIDEMRIGEADNPRNEMTQHNQQNRDTLDVVEKRYTRLVLRGDDNLRRNRRLGSSAGPGLSRSIGSNIPRQCG